jgi:hypothetical chaperone protein
MNSLGIDFGTSNCLAHVATPNDVFPVELESGSFSLPSVVFTARREVAMRQVEDSEFEKRLRQARLEERKRGGRALDETELQRAIRDAMRREAADEANKSYWDQTFFSLLKDGQAILFGTPALRAYFSDPLSGVLVKSPKSFLGSKISQNHLTHFENIVTAMLEHIRSVAETAHDCTITSAVLGRPVRYHGTQGKEGDSQALDVMSRAAARAGFKDVRYELEPLAAAYEYETSIREEQKLLVVDVGGGTTDCVMMRVSPDKVGHANRDDDILGVSGDRVGGTDFDEALAWHAFMAAFGKDTMRKNGFPVPHSLLYDAISIRNLPAQLRFAKSKREIADLIEQAVEPEKLTRLATLQEQQLQYRLVHSAEAAKIELSKTADLNVPLDYLDGTLTIPVNRRALGDASARLVDKVRELALEAVTAAGAQPDVVFLTGGMAISPIVSDAVADVVGKNVRLQSSDMLGTVGKGLGLCAQRVFGR